MAIKVKGTTVIEDDGHGKFNLVNPGVYTEAQRDLITTQQTGDVIYVTDGEYPEMLQAWDGVKWVPANGTGGAFGPIEVAGDVTTTTHNGYIIHTFEGRGSLFVTEEMNAHILMVGGGGMGGVGSCSAPPGGSHGGGGGGGGGVVYIPMDSSDSKLPVGPYNVTAGDGGYAETTPPPHGSFQPVIKLFDSQSSVIEHTRSQFETLEALGGGTDGYSSSTNERHGGSGGGSNGHHYPTSGAVDVSGGDGLQTTLSGLSGTYGFGNKGGDQPVASSNVSPFRPAGGGGGAGTEGNPAQDRGDGLEYTFFGDWCPSSIGTVGTGGDGAPGNGSSRTSPGDAYGAGGGGGGHGGNCGAGTAYNIAGNAGTNGIVVIAYKA